MATDPIIYQRSDAWLLLSIIYASREHAASLGEVLMAGEYIAHTGFLQEELDGGFYRLKAGNWIGRSIENSSPSAEALIEYEKIRGKNFSALDELNKIETLLGIKDAS